MSAPTLAEDWRGHLSGLQKGWDSYDGQPITEAAIRTIESFHTVPCSNGGIQLEIHRDGWEIEIVVTPEGRIESVFTTCEPQEPPKP